MTVKWRERERAKIKTKWQSVSTSLFFIFPRLLPIHYPWDSQLMLSSFVLYIILFTIQNVSSQDNHLSIQKLPSSEKKNHRGLCAGRQKKRRKVKPPSGNPCKWTLSLSTLISFCPRLASRVMHRDYVTFCAHPNAFFLFIPRIITCPWGIFILRSSDAILYKYFEMSVIELELS